MLISAGVDNYVEDPISVDEIAMFKPESAVYRYAATQSEHQSNESLT